MEVPKWASPAGKSSSSGNDANGARAKVAKAPFEMMIGTAVPREVPLKDIPPEITQVMNGFNGDQYVLVQDEMVIVDHASRRVVVIVPAVG